VAVGWYIDKSGDEQGLIETGSGSSWQASEAVLPANAAPEPPNAIMAFLNSVSCPATDECVAIGQYDPGNGFGQELILTQLASTWVAVEGPQPVPNSDTGASLEQVSCWAAKQCLAVGSYQSSDYSNTGSMISINGSKVSAAQAPLPANATGDNPDLTETGETCFHTAPCLTYGQYTTGSGWNVGVLISGSLA
jgi:hypothetical protein